MVTVSILMHVKFLRIVSYISILRIGYLPISSFTSSLVILFYFFLYEGRRGAATVVVAADRLGCRT